MIMWWIIGIGAMWVLSLYVVAVFSYIVGCNYTANAYLTHLDEEYEYQHRYYGPRCGDVENTFIRDKYGE